MFNLYKKWKKKVIRQRHHDEMMFAEAVITVAFLDTLYGEGNEVSMSLSPEIGRLQRKLEISDRARAEAYKCAMARVKEMIPN